MPALPQLLAAAVLGEAQHQDSRERDLPVVGVDHRRPPLDGGAIAVDHRPPEPNPHLLLGAVSLFPRAAVALDPFLRPHVAIFADVPEGDAIHRAARRLQAIVGERVAVEAPHPRAAATGVAERLDGRRFLGVEAVGKNLLLRFEDDLVVRSHLRMSGRWRIGPPDAKRFGRPWLVLRGDEHEAVLWGGPVLELHTRGMRRLGPDILAEPPDFDAMLRRLRAEHQGRAVGDALLDQRLLSGIGNVWKAESLWRARVSPWRALADVSDDELRDVLRWAARLMRRAVEGDRGERGVYRRVGRPCPRCRTPVRSRGQGDANRMAYWCPRCQSA